MQHPGAFLLDCVGKMRKRSNTIGTLSSYVRFNNELGVHTWKEKDNFSESRVENKLFCLRTDLGHQPLIETYEFSGGEKSHLFRVWSWRKPINIACYTGTLTQVKRLLGYGAKIKLLSDTEDPLLVAIRRQKIDIVEYFLTTGLDPNVFGGHTSPLSLACWMVGHDDAERRHDIVSLLIDCGANVNEILASNISLWERVLLYGNIRLVEIFLRSGLDCTILDRKGNNVMDIFIWGYLIRKYSAGNIYSTSQLLCLFFELRKRGAPLTESNIQFKVNMMTAATKNGCCGICMDNKELKTLLPCCHRFCTECVPQLVDCALCRSHILNRF